MLSDKFSSFYTNNKLFLEFNRKWKQLEVLTHFHYLQHTQKNLRNNKKLKVAKNEE